MKNIWVGKYCLHLELTTTNTRDVIALELRVDSLQAASLYKQNIYNKHKN